MKKLAIALMIISTISFTGCTQLQKIISNTSTNSQTNSQQAQSSDQTQNSQQSTGTEQADNTKQSKDTTQTNSTQQTPNNEIQYFFSQAKQQPDQELIKIINASKSNLDIAIFSITKKEIVDSILQAKKRGVDVRIITDRQQSTFKYEKNELIILSNAKIPIKVNSHKGNMELKVAIVDKKILTTGSYNYTDEATINSDEVLEVVNDSKVAEGFESQFERMWNDTKNFGNAKI